MMEKLQQCPVCGHDTMENWLNTQDYFFTREEFSIDRCNACGFRFLNPRPDESSIGRYYHSPDYVAHSNKSRGIMTTLYRLARKRNLSYKYNIIARYVKKGNVLDIGCATGEFLEYMRCKGWNIAGMEADEQVRKKTIEQKAIDIVPKNGMGIFPDQHFHVITLWHVLEHIHKMDLLIAEINRLLKAEGLLVLALPNPDSWDARHYGKFWAGLDLPRHLYHFSAKDVQFYFQKNGFTLKGIYPLKFDAFYVSMLSEKYQRGKPAMIGAVKTAMQSNRMAKKENNNFSSLLYVLRK